MTAAVAHSSAISVVGVTVMRGGHPVVNDVSFEIEPGQVVGLLGPSGCGKSSLIRSLAGVQSQVTGTVALLGKPAGSPSLRAEVAYMTQAASVYTDLTVRENLRYFAAILGVRSARIDEVIEQVDLVTSASSSVGRLSGGQTSRVSLAIALLGSPRVLLLDEPTVGLDPVLRRDLWNMFRSLAESGCALLVSSHVMDEATRCDRLLLMRNGALLTDTTPTELLASTGAPDAEHAFLSLIEKEKS